MKQFVRLVSLLLAILLLCGCSAAPVETAVPETTAPQFDVLQAAVQQAATPVQTAEKTEAALAQIRALGQSPDDNYRTW